MNNPIQINNLLVIVILISFNGQIAAIPPHLVDLRGFTSHALTPTHRSNECRRFSEERRRVINFNAAIQLGEQCCVYLIYYSLIFRQ